MCVCAQNKATYKSDKDAKLPDKNQKLKGYKQ